jgi:CheY-like chemotaxis protein
MMPLTMLLVDNSASFLDLLEHYFANSPYVRIVGRASGGAEAIQVLEQVDVEVVLMDMTMPGLSGLETTRHIRSLGGPARVVLMTGNDGPEYVQAALQAGADACLCKSDFFARIHGIIDRLRENRTERSTAPRNSSVPELAAAPLDDQFVHAFNNVLTKIAGYAELTLRSLPANHASQTWLREITKAVESAADLLRTGPGCQPLRDADPASPNQTAEASMVGDAILVVEDDEALLGFVRCVLTADGFTVLVARNGQEAERVCEESDWPIRLAIVDLNLAGQTGIEVAEQLRASRPGLRVLFMTGSGEEQIARAFQGEVVNLLAKPFTAAALVRETHDLLRCSMEVAL